MGAAFRLRRIDASRLCRIAVVGALLFLFRRRGFLFRASAAVGGGSPPAAGGRRLFFIALRFVRGGWLFESLSSEIPFFGILKRRVIVYYPVWQLRPPKMSLTDESAVRFALFKGTQAA